MTSSVVVECLNKSDGKISSCSGIIFDNCVITHGSLLYEPLAKRVGEKFAWQKNIFSLICDASRDCNFFTLRSVGKSGRENGRLIKKNISTSAKDGRGDQFIDNQLRWKATWVRFYHDKKLYSDLKRVFGSTSKWRFIADEDSGSTELQLYFLASFLILGRRFRLSKDWIGSMLDKSCSVEKGDAVVIESCPFGNISPEMFSNSLTQGIISNVNISNTLLVTDAHGVMGSEGAPVYRFVRDEPRLCGFVLSPYCWLNGEWLGITLLAAARVVFSNMLDSYDEIETTSPLSTTISLDKSSVLEEYSHMLDSEEKDIFRLKRACSQKRKFKDFYKTSMKATVGVMCKSGIGSFSWGTGVVIDREKGIILTCSHVVTDALDGLVDIIQFNGVLCQGKIIYQTKPSHVIKKTGKRKARTSDGCDMWDLAVIIAQSSFPVSLPLSHCLPSKGCEVILCGYGLFGYNSSMSVNISLGILSNINYLRRTEDKRCVGCDTDSKKKESGLKDFQTVEGNDCLEMDNTVWKKLSWSSVKDHSLDSSKVFPSETITSDQQDLLGRENNENYSLDNPILAAIQTSCAVFGGDSGGPVIQIDPVQGPFVIGIVVCCATNRDGKGLFPHINMAIPVCSVAEPLNLYCKTGDIYHLSGLGLKRRCGSKLLWDSEFKMKSKL